MDGMAAGECRGRATRLGSRHRAGSASKARAGAAGGEGEARVEQKRTGGRGDGTSVRGPVVVARTLDGARRRELDRDGRARAGHALDRQGATESGRMALDDA